MLIKHRLRLQQGAWRKSAVTGCFLGKRVDSSVRGMLGNSLKLWKSELPDSSSGSRGWSLNIKQGEEADVPTFCLYFCFVFPHHFEVSLFTNFWRQLTKMLVRVPQIYGCLGVLWARATCTWPWATNWHLALLCVK